MKILKLEFKNINSLKGFHKIDFTQSPFTGSALFAITGPTGSGKSTILDVISLALFNKIPRLDKVTKSEIIKTGAIITRNQQEAMAAVIYESRNGRFRSEWSISTARTGSLREYTMQLSHAESGELFSLKKSEVPEKNEQLIGLNYNQFIKSVLLAQGEFAQFLKAKKEERGELLEKITGTGIYRQLGRMAFDRHKIANAEILQQQQSIELIRAKLLEEDKREELLKALDEKVQMYAPLEKAMETLKALVELKKSIDTRKRQIAEEREGELKLKESLNIFDQEHGQPLQQHEKLRPFAEELREWARARSDSEDLAASLKTQSLEAEQNLLEIQQCLEATGDFTKGEITVENIAQNLSEFQEKISSLQEMRRQKLEVHGNLKSRLEATLADIEFPWTDSPEARFSFLEDMKIASAEKQQELKEKLQLDLENLDQEKDLLRQRLEKARAAQLESVQIERFSEDLVRLGTETASLEARKKDLPLLQEKLRLKVESGHLKVENLRLKRDKKALLASMEEHRKKLKPGEACHLCGSIEHPYAINLPETEDSLDREIKAASEKLRELNHELSSVTANLSNLEKRLEEILETQSSIKAKLQEKQNSFSLKFGAIEIHHGESWEELCKQLESALRDLETYEKEQRHFKAISIGIPLHRELNQVLLEGRDLKQQLDGLYAGSDIHKDCQQLQNNWIRLSQQQNYLKEQRQVFQEKIDEKAEIITKLEKKLKPTESLGFVNLLEAKKALLSEAQYQRLSEERQGYLNALHGQSTSIKLLESQLKELQQRDVAETVEELGEDLRTRTMQLQAIQKDCEEHRRVLKNHQELLEEMKSLVESIAVEERKIKRWRLLNELIGDATGKKFNDFAQDLSLSQLIHLANIRLKDLSDRYRIDKPGGEEDDGLVAIDEHMGGQRRSVKTLSGGETFILSLSMALALSDLASKNVEINSLFIDEGFGTLDPETLDQTLDTLEKLQAESSKTIGIISHVDSLKERIAIQVQLKRNGQGYSQLEIV